MKDALPRCARCPFEPEERLCAVPDGKAPSSCPCRDKELVAEVRKKYSEPDLKEFARQASIQEAEGYSGRGPGCSAPRPCKPRLQEIGEFAHKMGFKKLGLVFCVGLRREAEAVEGYYTGLGYNVASVVCKAGRIPKEELGVRDSQKIMPGTPESMCNPVLQALALNRAGTELNIVLGLCVGHDSIFMKHSEALCTVLAAKDRPSGHNPMGAVYTLDSYHRYLREN